MKRILLVIAGGMALAAIGFWLFGGSGSGGFGLAVTSLIGTTVAGWLVRFVLFVAVALFAYFCVRGITPAETLRGTAAEQQLGLDKLPEPQLGEIAELRREEAEARAAGLQSGSMRP